MSETTDLPAGILLAAGQSTRFGTDKLLHELRIGGRCRPLIHHTLLAWWSVFDEVCVVIRPDNPRLQQAIVTLMATHKKSVRLLTCNDATQGLAHSLGTAIQANDAAQGWLIGLADMPLIPTDVLKQLYHNLRQDVPITAPYCAGQRGHPVGLNRCYKEALLALKGDTGARHLLQRDTDKIVAVITDHPGVLADVDEPEDVNEIEKLPMP